jgi:DNA-binding MarR family transcriptional regulator
MSDVSSSDLERLAEGLHSSALRLLRTLRREDRTSGVGPAQLSALSVLVFAGPRRLGRLALDEGVRPPTMTRVVAALEKEGLVRRVADATDRRSSVVEATSKGKAVLLAGRDARVRELARRIGSAGWSVADRRAVARVTRLLFELAKP